MSFRFGRRTQRELLLEFNKIKSPSSKTLVRPDVRWKTTTSNAFDGLDTTEPDIHPDNVLHAIPQPCP